MEYYAVFSEIANSDLLAFNTKAERDEWVAFMDEPSVVLHMTPDNSFKRAAVTDSKLIKSIVNNLAIPVSYGSLVLGIKYYLRSLMWLPERDILLTRQADGIDFVKDVIPNYYIDKKGNYQQRDMATVKPQILKTVTKEDFAETFDIAYPESRFMLWKMIDGKKTYIQIE